MIPINSIIGEKIGEFTAIEFSGRDSHGVAQFTWRCVCGNTIVKSKQAMQRRKNPTCGCKSFTRVCPDCQTQFETRSRNKQYCDECRDKRVKARNKKNHEARPRKRRKKIEFDDTSLEGMNREARKRGMTYGQLQALRMSEAMSWGR